MRKPRILSDIFPLVVAAALVFGAALTGMLAGCGSGDLTLAEADPDAAPNYPVLNVSWFKMASRARTPDPWDIFDVDDGWGAAVNLGYREMGWTLGGSAMVKRRPIEEGGDATTHGVYGAFNPWFYSRGIPLAYQAEYDYGSFQRTSGIETNQSAFYPELDWLAFNGVNILVAHDWVDPDTEVIEDGSHRISAGAQITPLPGVTLDGRVRALIPEAGGDDADFFI